MTFYSWVGSTARKWFGSLYVLQFNTNFSASAILSAGRAFLQYNVQWKSVVSQVRAYSWLHRVTVSGYARNVDMIIESHCETTIKLLKRLRLWLLAGYIAHCHVAISILAGFGIHFWWWFFSLQQINRLDLLLSVKSNKKRQQTWEPPPTAFRSWPVPSFPWHWVNAA